MKSLSLLIAVGTAVALAGCYSPQRAEENAQDMAAAQCARQGQVFVQTSGSAAATPAVTTATARGHCVDPAEGGPPPPPPGQ